jgi:hypothetical protein
MFKEKIEHGFFIIGLWLYLALVLNIFVFFLIFGQLILPCSGMGDCITDWSKFLLSYGISLFIVGILGFIELIKVRK